MILLAFHNSPSIKAKYLDRIRIHAMQDEIIHGKYWENGKGCAWGARSTAEACGLRDGTGHPADARAVGGPLV